MGRIRRRLTYANVMATLALFVALSGTAYAAVIIHSNGEVASNTISGHNPPEGAHANIMGLSVTTSDIESQSIETGKIAPEAVTTGKIAPEAVTADQIASRAVKSGKIDQGAVGNARLADDAVTGDKILDDSVSGADVLNRGLSDSDIGSAAQVNGADLPSIGANSCMALQLNFGSWTQVGELVLANARDGGLGGGTLFITTLVVTTPGSATGRVCNLGTSASNPDPEDILAWSIRQSGVGPVPPPSPDRTRAANGAFSLEMTAVPR